MATVAELARLRNMIAEPDGSEGWSDARLEEFIAAALNADGTTNLRAAAAEIWEAKAADAAELVDVTESSSARRNSQYFDHAQKMAMSYRGSGVDVTSTANRPSSVAIRRPTRG